MSHDFFRFRQFIVRHDRCAMKVGTDGVLLGAWGCVEGKSILDIGTGTGLIALMAAQRNPRAEVLGIDIDEAAVLQAKENIEGSPFHERVSCVLSDVMALRPTKHFDAILCNPPFFTEDTLPEDKGRALARNNKSLPFPQLIKKVATLLTEKGRFSFIVPVSCMQEILGLCLEERLYLNRRCLVHTSARKPPRRVMLSFSKERTICDEQQICLVGDDGKRSMQYTELTKDFYL